MEPTSATGDHTVLDLAQRYGFSPEAVVVMRQSVAAGNGRMAQFDHPDFGGSGQWMRGGMTMVGDMFDGTLKERVAGLCSELARSLEEHANLSEAQNRPTAAAHQTGETTSASGWWPDDLGEANSAGAQDGMRYAYFAHAHRLAIDDGGTVSLYDTLDHQISGVAQGQSSRTSLAFFSQKGVVDVASLPIVGNTSNSPVSDSQPRSEPSQTSTTVSASDALSTIEKLAELRGNGVLSNAEFATKKAELLKRI